MKNFTLSLLTLSLTIACATSHADDIPNAQVYADGVPYRGISLSGAEFKDEGGWVKSGASVPTLYDSALFMYRGMNIYRIPVAWEYLAADPSNPDGNINTSSVYWTNLKTTINNLTAHGAYVLLDMHDYMRYNPNDVSQDYNPSNLNIIGSGNPGAPTQGAYANLWANLVKQFPNSHMMYDIMNEPHDMDSRLVIANQNAAIKGIRTQEQTLGVKPHKIFIEGNYWTGLHSWFDSSQGKANSDAYANGAIQDPANNYVIEVHQYFDSDSSGQYVSGDCVADTSQYTTYASKIATWSKQNKVPVFLGEFGAPDTPTCHKAITTMLDAINSNAASASNPYGFIGWSAWSAGHGWGNYILSMAPGGPANTEMWASDLYTHYLTQVAPLPPLPPVAATVTNNTKNHIPLLFSSGAWPFQLQGSATLAYGQTAKLYSNNATLIPDGKIELTYHTDPNNQGDVLGIGIADGWGYSYANSQTTITPNASCDITPPNGDTKRCWTVN